MKVPTYDEMVKYNSEAKDLEMLINTLITENRYNDIYEILETKESKEIAGRNQTIYILYILSQIMHFEIPQNVDRILFEGRDSEEAIRLYRNLSMYLRRIEFDLPIEYQKEIVDYILSERISVVAIMYVIKYNGSIHQKEKVTLGLKKILEDI